MQNETETAITEIEIGADGRVFLFGASREILECLRDLGFADEALRQRIELIPPTKPPVNKSENHITHD